MNTNKALTILKQQVKFYSCSPIDCPCEYQKICDEITKENCEPAMRNYTVCKANQIAIDALEKQNTAKNLLEKAREEIQNCYCKDIELTEEISKFLESEVEDETIN